MAGTCGRAGLGRRSLGTGTLGTVVAGGIAAAVTRHTARAAEGTLVVANWGGDWNERTMLVGRMRRE